MTTIKLKLASASTSKAKLDADAWENDPYLTQSPKRTALIAKGALETLALLDTDPADIADAATRKAYEKYLKAQEGT